MGLKCDISDIFQSKDFFETHRLKIIFQSKDDLLNRLISRGACYQLKSVLKFGHGGLHRYTSLLL